MKVIRSSLSCFALCALGTSCSFLFDSAGPASQPDATVTVIDGAIVHDAGVPSMPFPPSSDVNLVDGIVGDVNRDGIDDLLLATAPNGGSENGVFILLGPQAGPGLVFHHFVPTVAEPISIALGQGALGMDEEGKSTLLVGHRETTAAVDAFVYDIADGTFGPALRGLSTSGSDPLAVVTGDFDRNGIADDVVMAALRGLLKFFRWQPEGDPAEPNGETLEADILTLGTLAAGLDDELIVVLKKPRVFWRYFDDAPLSGTASFAGSCGALFLAQVAQYVDVNDQLIDVVATSGNRLCGYRLESKAGIRTIREFHHPFDNASVHLLPAPSQGFDDIAVVNLGGQTEPEIVLLDTFNTLPTKITLVLDATERSAGAPGVLGMTSVTSVELEPPMSPAFLLAPDFDNDGTSEVWAIDLRARDVACLKLSESGLTSCFE